jgi:hypothetical protein
MRTLLHSLHYRENEQTFLNIHQELTFLIVQATKTTTFKDQRHQNHHFSWS